MDVEIWHVEPGTRRWKFTIDVLSQNQCKNCYFPDVQVNSRDVDRLSPDEFADLCFLPEVFADFVATELLNHYNRG
ncbi:hypothetical protein D3C80_1796360 [compost metagenome]